MTLWSDLFKPASDLPAVAAPDIGKALMVRAGPAWVPSFIQPTDVAGLATSNVMRRALYGDVV
jgi:hypothetical protein